MLRSVTRTGSLRGRSSRRPAKWFGSRTTRTRPPLPIAVLSQRYPDRAALAPGQVKVGHVLMKRRAVEGSRFRRNSRSSTKALSWTQAAPPRCGQADATGQRSVKARNRRAPLRAHAVEHSLTPPSLKEPRGARSPPFAACVLPRLPRFRPDRRGRSSCACPPRRDRRTTRTLTST